MNFKRNKPRSKDWDDQARDKSVEESEVNDRLRTTKVEKPFLIEALYPPSDGEAESVWKHFKEFASRNQRDAELRKVQIRETPYYSGPAPFEYRAKDL